MTSHNFLVYQKPPMKIEVGKLYETRDGRKVRVYAREEIYIRESDSMVGEIHGAIQSNEIWHGHVWNLKGKQNNTSDQFDSDIVSEWVEPKPKMQAWIQKIQLCDKQFVAFFPEGNDPKNNDPHSSYSRAPWLDEPEAK